MIDIRNYINLIKNHGYKGGIAIAKEDIGGLGISAKKGDVVLFQKYSDRWDDSPADRQYNATHCTIEKPYGEEEIQRRRVEGNGITTYCTCVGVPISLLNEILI